MRDLDLGLDKGFTAFGLQQRNVRDSLALCHFQPDLLPPLQWFLLRPPLLFTRSSCFNSQLDRDRRPALARALALHGRLALAVFGSHQIRKVALDLGPSILWRQWQSQGVQRNVFGILRKKFVLLVAQHAAATADWPAGRQLLLQAQVSLVSVSLLQPERSLAQLSEDGSRPGLMATPSLLNVHV